MASHVVVLGAGTVGTSIAQLLCANRVNVSVVDESRAALDRVEEELDVSTVCGSACEAIPLFQAGISNANLCLAVTQRDEVNLIGAAIAKAMGARRSVARIFNPAYRDFSTIDYQRLFGIDRLLSLEQLTALEIAKAIRSPGLFAVENFARGGVQVQEVEVDPRSRLAGKPLHELELPPRVKIGLVQSEGATTIPHGDHVLRPGDHVTLIGGRDAIVECRKKFERSTPERLNIIVAGGGEIGFHLARSMQQDRYRLVILEADRQRCNYLAQRLPRATILNADTTNRSEMEEARVGSADVFVAATGRDEDNIICGVEARELGTRRIISVVRRPDYANVLEKLGIDVAVSPREIMAREVLGMVSGGAILARSELCQGAAQVWEIEVQPNAPITRGKLRDLNIQQCLIAAIVRAETVNVVGGDDDLRASDNAIVLVPRGAEKETLSLFETSPH